MRKLSWKYKIKISGMNHIKNMFKTLVHNDYCRGKLILIFFLGN